MQTRIGNRYAASCAGLALTFSLIDLVLARAFGAVPCVDTAAVDMPSSTCGRLSISSLTAAFFDNPVV